MRRKGELSTEIEKALVQRGGGGSFGSNSYAPPLSLMFWFWAALTVFSVISVVLFSCTDGAADPKNKNSNGDSNVYVGGSVCGAECAAGCGA